VVFDSHGVRARLLGPVLIYVGLLVAVVSSLGAPLIPTIAADYGVSLGTAQWSLTVTLLVGAITSPIVGRLGDGPRRLQVLLVSLGVLVVGSALAALPTKVFALLIVGRGMQGIGLALLPLAMSVARDHLEPARSRSTVATLSVTAVVGVGLGYPITGLIAEHLTFRDGFWLAAILGLLAMILAALLVPSSTHRPSRPFDLVGALVLGAALAALLLAISEGDHWGWSSPVLLTVGAAAIGLLGVWIWHELRTAEPLVELRQMAQRTVLTADVTGVLAGIGMYMLMSMVIRYVQTPTSVSYGLGTSVVVAGLILLPLSVASFVASKVANALTRFVRPSRMLPVGALLFVAALLTFAGYRDHLWQIFLTMGIAGVAMGCSFAVMPRMIIGVVPAHETASALALNQVLRTIGYSIGSALSAAVLTAHTAASSPFPTASGYTDGALVAIALCLVTAVASAVLPARSRSAPGTATLNADQALMVEESVDSAIAGTVAFESVEPLPSGPAAYRPDRRLSR
jgi:predicted MFS family arabinose efflux permease